MKVTTLPFTNPYKQNLIFSGKCCQTIREGSKHKTGEVMRLICWTGTPWKSEIKKDFYVHLTSVKDIYIFKSGALLPHYSPWSSYELYELAKADGIENPDGKTLKKVLGEFYRITKIPRQYQILKWDYNIETHHRLSKLDTHQPAKPHTDITNG